jgi:glycosyltransferase involved in cell wall biosynthesis
LRILVLNWRDPRNPEAGGAEVHLHEIMRRAASSGHEIVQVSHAVPGLPREESIDGIRILRHGGRFTFNLGLRRFCRRLDFSSFDLVVEDLCKLPFFAPRWSSTPVAVLVPHLFGTTAYREVALPLAMYVNALEAFIPKAYSGCRFVAISNSTKVDLVKRGISAGSIEVIPCGMDASFYTPDAAVAPEPGTILYVGRVRKYKGIQHLLEAVSLLRKRGVDARLRIVGTGDYLAPLKKLTARLGLSDAVEFTGFVPADRKLFELRRAWVAALPSEKEGWGLTVIEANACGTPVVASDSDGLRDSVRQGETGLLVPHGRPEALANALQSILRDPATRSRLAAGGLAWARTFTWERAASDTIAALERASSPPSDP